MIDKRGAVTNGDVIKAVFPNIRIKESEKLVDALQLDILTTFSKYWWNSPYRECDKE